MWRENRIDTDLYAVDPGYQINCGNTLLLLPFNFWIPQHFFLLFGQHHEARGRTIVPGTDKMLEFFSPEIRNLDTSSFSWPV